jgi:4-amino-4-deoxy-L-arabinose transferase-like glycosyltransferase
MMKRIPFVASVVLVVLVAGAVRIYAAQRLNVDYDEPVYLGDAVSYARYMRLGDLKMLAWSETTYEHPALYKILYGVALLTQSPIDRLPDKDLPRLAPIAATAAGPWNVADRYLSVFWGTLAVLALALINPLAGLFLAVNTLSVKYTSEVYLEALPLLSSLLCALAYVRWFTRVRRDPAAPGSHLIWLILSAIFLGITAASKYVYCIVGLAILIHFIAAASRKLIPPRLVLYIVAWAVLALIMFFAFDPYLWPHPIARLGKSILFHEEFQGSRLVKMYHYPFWQPLRWLSDFAAYYDLGPASAFLIDLDTLLFVAALIGLPRLLRRQPFLFCWLVVGLLFLIIWTTKWPQYTLIILAPFSMAAAQGFLTIWDLARGRFARRSESSAPNA